MTEQNQETFVVGSPQQDNDPTNGPGKDSKQDHYAADAKVRMTVVHDDDAAPKPAKAKPEQSRYNK